MTVRREKPNNVSPAKRLDALIDAYTPAVANIARGALARLRKLVPGAVELVGTDSSRIVAAVSRLLNDPHEYARRQIDRNPYGDGHAAERIVELVLKQSWN